MAEEAILGFLEKGQVISDSGVFASEHGIDHNDIVNVIKSLHGFRYVDAEVGPIYFFSVITISFCIHNSYLMSL